MKILNILKKDKFTLKIKFHFSDNNLIYYIDFINNIKFCLLLICEKNIFYQIHDANFYIDLNKTYKIIIFNYFFHNLIN